MRIGAMGAVEDRRRLQTRITALRLLITAAFGLLLAGFWFFQVFQHAKFREMAENNHQRTLPLRAPRGVMFDRHGEVLVENRASFNISIMREHSRDLARTVRLLAQVTGADEAEMRDTVERHRREPSYRPVVVVQDATLAQVAAVTARRLDFELPDVVVQQVPTRKYPTDALGAHLIGYVGEASEQQVADGTVRFFWISGGGNVRGPGMRQPSGSGGQPGGGQQLVSSSQDATGDLLAWVRAACEPVATEVWQTGNQDARGHALYDCAKLGRE